MAEELIARPVYKVWVDMDNLANDAKKARFLEALAHDKKELEKHYGEIGLELEFGKNNGEAVKVD